MQAIFASTMQQDPPQLLRWVSCNGVNCALQESIALLGPLMKYLALKGHIGEFSNFFIE